MRKAGADAAHKIPFMLTYVLTFTHTFLKSHIKTLTKENKPFRRPLGQNYRDALFCHKSEQPCFHSVLNPDLIGSVREAE